MTLITCKLDEIRLDGDTQPRTGISEAVVADYAEAILRGDALPPVVAFWDGTHRWLGDGYHRVHANRQAGGVMIEVDQRNGTRRDALMYSVGANSHHGLQRTADDKRKAVRLVLEDEEWGQWSDRRISEVTNTSPTFVGKVRASLQPAASVHVDTYKAGHVSTKTDSPSVHVDTKPEVRKAVRGGKEFEVKVKPRPEPAATPDADDDSPSAADLLDEMQREVETLQATVKAMEADDKAAEVLKHKRIADAAQRGQSEAMERAAQAVDREAWTMRQLRRCGKAIGEDDPANVAAKVEALARQVRGKVAA
ncbi:MAG: hypothetical protein Q8N17_26250 [Burkholderiaceae bacterium]|nr:hypothetical protein [Burkholderiaceae bacterium]